MLSNILNDDEILNKYKSMTRDEVLNLFGENKNMIQKELGDGTFSYDKLKEVCNISSTSLDESRKKEVLLTSRLSKCEAFNLFERDKAKQREYAVLEAIKQKAENGTLSLEELNTLCDNINTSDAKNAAHSIIDSKTK